MDKDIAKIVMFIVLIVLLLAAPTSIGLYVDSHQTWRCTTTQIGNTTTTECGWVN